MTLNKNQKAIWKNNILKQQSSGKTIAGWCRENNVLPRSFYYWRVKVFPKKIDRLNFIELKSPLSSSVDNNTPLIIKYYGAEISIKKGFDVGLLQSCLKVLQGIQCL